ncbi:MAG: hypothetical protein GX640_04220 [Fibrobacter sp.]|nr:hypothetical protein [Fibrobacter sp.]
MSMNRNEMIMYLHEIDADLRQPVDLVICGASAAILNHGLKRNSIDIDVLNTSVPLLLLKDSIEKVAKKYNFDSKWLNDESKILYTHLPENYKPDTEKVAGESFKYLKANVVKKADFIITKLAFYEQIRNKDIADIKAIEINRSDVSRFYEKLDEIAISNQIDALKMESIFKQCRPELVKTLDGYSFHNEKDIAAYCLERYSLTPPDTTVENWKYSLDTMNTQAGLIIAQIDWNAAKRMNVGCSGLKKDLSFRILRGKEHGMEL